MSDNICGKYDPYVDQLEARCNELLDKLAQAIAERDKLHEQVREQQRELDGLMESANVQAHKLTKAKEAFRLIIDDYHQGRNEGMMVCSAMVSMRCKAEKALTELEGEKEQITEDGLVKDIVDGIIAEKR